MVRRWMVTACLLWCWPYAGYCDCTPAPPVPTAKVFASAGACEAVQYGTPSPVATEAVVAVRPRLFRRNRSRMYHREVSVSTTRG
jgi:hypothetical protein